MSFSALQDGDFFGRSEELAALSRRADEAEQGRAKSAVLSGPPGIGKTELLKQLFGHLFWRQEGVVPFYYEVIPALLSAAAFSRDYLTKYLCQRLAFDKKEQSLFYLEGISLDSLSLLIEERQATWAGEILDRYVQNSREPLDALRIALNAPHQSMIATGMPVAVLIDDFHRLKELHIDNAPDPGLVSLFETPMSFGRIVHVVAGNAAEIREMPVSSGLEKIRVEGLSHAEMSAKTLSLLHLHQIEGSGPSPLLLEHLGGNPFYLESVLKRASMQKNPAEPDYWKAYFFEITDGILSSRWSSILKKFFPDAKRRRAALTMAHKIYHAKTPFSYRLIAKTCGMSDQEVEAIAQTLYLAGFADGEYGVFRAVQDEVLRDVIDCVYKKEFFGKSSHDVVQEFSEKFIPKQGKVVRYEMKMPMAKEVELVAAQCLDQIGKNLHMNADAIGQLQVAVIEACINAMEHSGAADRTIYLCYSVDGDQVIVSVESSGQEFVMQETGEPFDDKKPFTKADGRGWGIKLMKRFVDEVRFEKTMKGTRTVLVKNMTKITGQKENAGDRE